MCYAHKVGETTMRLHAGVATKMDSTYVLSNALR